MTTPTPAAIPRAGLSLTESLRRQEAAQDAADGLLLAPAGALELIAAEQGVEPVTDPDELAAADPMPAEEAGAFTAAIHEPNPAPKPSPPSAWIPGYVRPPNLIARDQHIRRLGLELAVAHYHDLNAEPAEVLATARTWAEWIRTGK